MVKLVLSNLNVDFATRERKKKLNYLDTVISPDIMLIYFAVSLEFFSNACHLYYFFD